METRTTEKIKRFLGTCKACKKAGRAFGVRVDALVKIERTETPTVATNGAAGWPRISYRYWIAAPGESLSVARDIRYLPASCPRCSKQVLLESVAGVKSEKKCGARCLNATGPSCDCSCGGANHGGNH